MWSELAQAISKYSASSLIPKPFGNGLVMRLEAEYCSFEHLIDAVSILLPMGRSVGMRSHNRGGERGGAYKGHNHREM